MLIKNKTPNTCFRIEVQWVINNIIGTIETVVWKYTSLFAGSNENDLRSESPSYSSSKEDKQRRKRKAPIDTILQIIHDEICRRGKKMGLDGVFLKLKRQKETERKIKFLPRGDILPKVQIKNHPLTASLAYLLLFFVRAGQFWDMSFAALDSTSGKRK